MRVRCSTIEGVDHTTWAPNGANDGVKRFNGLPTRISSRNRGPKSLDMVHNKMHHHFVKTLKFMNSGVSPSSTQTQGCSLQAASSSFRSRLFWSFVSSRIIKFCRSPYFRSRWLLLFFRLPTFRSWLFLLFFRPKKKKEFIKVGRGVGSAFYEFYSQNSVFFFNWWLPLIKDLDGVGVLHSADRGFPSPLFRVLTEGKV